VSMPAARSCRAAICPPWISAILHLLERAVAYPHTAP